MSRNAIGSPMSPKPIQPNVVIARPFAGNAPNHPERRPPLRNSLARPLLPALAALTLAAGLGGVVRADTPTCARPNVPATLIHGVEPVVPGLAARSNIGGEVRVVVSLDPSSHVVGVRIDSSASALLDGAALDAASASAYQTQICDCRPIAADYVYAMSFPGGHGVVSGGTVDGPLVTITATGSVARVPDMATLRIALVTEDEASPAAVAKGEAANSEFASSVRGLGIAAANIEQTAYNVQYNPRPGPTARPFPFSFATTPPRFGYVVTRQVRVTVTPLERVAGVVSAAVAAGATGMTLQYGTTDGQGAYREALASAIRSAATQAETIASASRMRVAGVTYVEERKILGASSGAYSGVPLTIRFGPPGTATTAPQPPSSIFVAASAIVTYALKR